jgi:pimeloyl-ACP methyl ester carboxylesterase
LLLLHGNPAWSFLYREIVKELRGQFRCVAVDYPGFGLSAAPPRYGFTPAEGAGLGRPDEANTAFGGEKASGIGRFGGQWAAREFTTDHWVSVQRRPREYAI